MFYQPRRPPASAEGHKTTTFPAFFRFFGAHHPSFDPFPRHFLHKRCAEALFSGLRGRTGGSPEPRGGRFKRRFRDHQVHAQEGVVRLTCRPLILGVSRLGEGVSQPGAHERRIDPPARSIVRVPRILHLFRVECAPGICKSERRQPAQRPRAAGAAAAIRLGAAGVEVSQ